MFDAFAFLALAACVVLVAWSQYEFREAIASLERSKAILDESRDILARSRALHDRTARNIDTNSSTRTPAVQDVKE